MPTVGGKEPNTQTIRLRFQGPASRTASRSMSIFMSAQPDHGEAARAQAAAILVERAQQAIARVADMVGRLARRRLRILGLDEGKNPPVLAPGLLARGFGPYLQPACSR